MTGPSLALNSYDEWTRLHEVVLGSPINYDAHTLDLSFEFFFHDVRKRGTFYPTYGTGHGVRVDSLVKSVEIKRQYVEELQEDLEEFSNTLSSLGVTVLRPEPLSELGEIQTPNWRSGNTPALNVRDHSIVLGDVFLETAPHIRSRYFENDQLRPIIYGYFNRGCKWLSMPRPVLLDTSYDLSYNEERPIPTLGDVYVEGRPSPTGFEIMLDGAQCVRIGQDVLVNVSNANHRLGFDWLETTLGDRFRFHPLDRVTDHHLDAHILALAPGKFLVRSRGEMEKLPEPFRSWDAIVTPDANSQMFPSYDEDDIVLTSEFIDLNVLSIDESTVVVNSAFVELMKVLEQQGFDVVPVRHRHRRLFGGGFHCFTLDTVRAGGPDDYR